MVLYTRTSVCLSPMNLSFITGLGEGGGVSAKNLEEERENYFPFLHRRGRKRNNETGPFVHLPLLCSR